MVPVTAGNPSAGGQLRPKAADSLGKLLRSGCVSKVNARELKTTAKEVHVRVVKSWKDYPFLRINHTGARACHPFYFFACADRHDAIAVDRNSLCQRLLGIHCMHNGVYNN